MHMPRRSMLATLIVVCLIGMPGPFAMARTPVAASNPVANGFRPLSTAFFDADHGVVAGTIVCPTCAKHRTAAISTTADGGQTWSAPTTFHAALARSVTVVPGGVDAWAQVGTRLQHSNDGGSTWSILPKAGVSDPSFGTATDGWALRRATVFSTVVATVGRRRHLERRPGPVPARGAERPSSSCARRSTTAGSSAGVTPQRDRCGRSCGRRSTGARRGRAASTASHRAPSGTTSSTTVTAGGGTTTSPTSSARRTAGTTWNDLGAVSGGNVLVEDVWFVSDTNGFAVVLRSNDSSRLLTSDDGGSSWTGVVGFAA